MFLFNTKTLEFNSYGDIVGSMRIEAWKSKEYFFKEAEKKYDVLVLHSKNNFSPIPLLSGESVAIRYWGYKRKYNKTDIRNYL
jgi:hypothetical protein